MKDLKNYIGFILVGLFGIMLGCGGGGGGTGGGTNSNGSTTGFTTGQAPNDPSSTIIGRAMSRTTSGLEGVVVRFYTGGGTFVGSATSLANGYFDANIPSSATRCEIDATTVPNSVQRLYQYNLVVYQAVGNGLTCNRVLLPPITPGVLTPMVTACSFYLNSDPPVFPGGCF